MRPFSAAPPALRHFTRGAILALFLLANLLTLDTGWADNGDYHRIMRWFTSGPAELENWPAPGSEAWRQRFFEYWVPDWKLDFPGGSEMFVSALLVWAPGVALNRFFFSAYTLSLPILSIGARALLFLYLCLVLRWAERRSPTPLLAALTLGVPLVLLFTSADVAAFYNTFYQETGLIVFFPLLLAVLVWGRSHPRDWRFYLVYLLAVFLAATAKSSLFYLPLLALPFALPFERLRARPAVYLPLALLLTAVPVLASLVLTHVPTAGPYRQYNSLFTGALLFSRDPQAHLARLGMPDAGECVGADHYSNPVGARCLQTYADKITYTAVVKTILAEPAILPRQLAAMAAIFQNYTLDLGRYAYGDISVRQELRLNLW